jgi:hypothetical protein
MPAPLNDAYTVALGARLYAGRFPVGLRGAAQLPGLAAAGSMGPAMSQASGAASLGGVGAAGQHGGRHARAVSGGGGWCVDVVYRPACAPDRG